MISGINLKETIKYSCKRDTDNPTVWELGLIPSRLIASMASSATTDNGVKMLVDMVRIGVKNISNFQISGKELEFKTKRAVLYGIDVEALEDSVIDAIPFEVITELAEKLSEINKLTDKELKN